MTIKKVLIQLNQVGYGGTEKAILSFAQYLDRRQFEPYLFYWDDRDSIRYHRLQVLGSFSKKAQQRFNSLYRHRYSREEQFMKTFGKDHCYSGKLREFKACLEKIRPDILHLNRGVETDFYTEYIPELPRSIHIIESNIFGKSSTPNYLERVDLFLFVSNWLKDKSTWAQSKSETLYNPILPSQSSEDLREQLNIPQDAIVLGRAHRPDLGHDDFLEKVYSSLEEKDIFFLCLGSEPDYSSLFFEKYQSRMRSLPPTTDEKVLSRFYNTVDIFTHRRVEGETFGMIIAEAMAHSKPVLSHRSQVDNAQIEVIGDERLISGLDDVQAYRKILSDLIKNKAMRKEVGDQLQKRAINLFAPEALTRQLESYYLTR